MDAHPKATIARYFALWNTGRADQADGIVQDGYVDHANESIVDTASLVSEVLRIRARTPNLHVYVDAVLADTETRYTVVGRVVDRWGPDTGEHARIWTFRVEEGLLAEVWTYIDLTDVADPSHDGEREAKSESE